MALTFRRIERKFLINEEQYKTVLKFFDANMQRDKYNNGQYEVFNIYYDTKDNSIIRHSVSKPWYKEKLRLRSYSYPLKDDSPIYLELKKKIDGIVTKRRIGLTYKEASDFVNKGINPNKDSYIENQIIKEIGYFLSVNEVEPSLFLHYKRLAYFDPNNPTLRITLDRSLKAQHLKEQEKDEHDIIGQEEYLLEIKSTYNYPEWLIKLLEEQGIRRTSFSKYGKDYEKCIKERKIEYV